MFNIDRTFKLLDNPIPQGSKYSVPEYVVGSHQLLLFYDGLLCMKSTPDRENQYIEVGNRGELSTEIELHFNLEKNSEFTAIVFHFTNDIKLKSSKNNSIKEINVGGCDMDSTYKTDIDVLKSDLKVIKPDITCIKSDIIDIKSDISILRNDIKKEMVSMRYWVVGVSFLQFLSFF
jgi:hypothetical protein